MRLGLVKMGQKALLELLVGGFSAIFGSAFTSCFSA